MTTLSLYNGDCLTVMKDLSGGSVDLIICDLPYGCLANDRKGKRVGALKDPNNPNSNIVIENKPCSWDIKIDLEAFWKEVKRIRRNEHTPCIHFCTTKFGIDLINSNPSEFRYDLVWDKQRGVSFLSANKMPMRSHEMVYVFSKSGAYYNRVDISGNYTKWVGKRAGTPSEQSTQYGGAKRNDTEGGDGKRCALSIISEKGGNRKTTGHPTEKPIELYKWLIERYSPKGGTVLDPTFGSGNSGQASWELDRSYIGIEKDKRFYDKACKKLIPET